MHLDLLDQILLHRKPLSEQPSDAPPPAPSMADSKPKAEEACPVDHKSREAWLAQARSQSQAQALPPDHPPVPDGAESCPVDHNARAAWLQQAGASSSPGVPKPPASQPQSQAQPPAQSWTSSILSYVPFTTWSSSTTTPSAQAPSKPVTPAMALGNDRVISSIPRSSNPGDAACPPNQEQETGADKVSGNWVYPSERMFFEAMRRKGHDPQAPDMQTVVPIHNAVNERAWAEIKQWEQPYIIGTSCGGPRLHSFSGLSTKMSPKARFNTFLGYQPPFDRHDWVVDRCGKEIEYVIDFYAGRPTNDGKPSFYLDVRPKLNSWEGVKMRVARSIGYA